MLELYENHYNLINVIKLHLDKNEMHFIIEKNNGTVLKFILSKVDFFYTETQIQSMIASVDGDKDGRLNFQGIIQLQKRS